MLSPLSYMFCTKILTIESADSVDWKDPFQADIFSSSEDILRFSVHQNVHYSLQKSPNPYPIHRHTDPVQSFDDHLQYCFEVLAFEAQVNSSYRFILRKLQACLIFYVFAPCIAI